MGNSKDLDGFIKAAKEQGAADEFLVAMLREKGWPAKEVYVLLARHYAELTGFSIPEPPSRLESAREAFFHLLAFAALATWAFSIGSVWFHLIANWFPDLTFDRQNDFSIGQISWQLACIIVAFPAFIWATRSILGDLLENPDKAESPVRRWVTNVGLLLTALVFMGDLVTFVTSFLQGQLTIRFALDCVVAFILAGAVFLYYSRSLGKSRTLPPVTWHRAFAAVAGVVIVVTLSFGFWFNGSPASARVLNEDSQRMRDLHEMAFQINVLTKGSPAFVPPANLAGLKVNKIDRQTRRDYEYQPLGGTQYQLCAHFEAAGQKSSGGESAEFWAHSSGRQCFVFDSTKELVYPPVEYR